MKNNHNIAILSARFLAEEMSECEKAAFLNQLKNNRTMQDEFEKMKKTWNNMDTIPSGKFNHTGKAWEELKNRLYSDSLLSEPASPPHTPGWYILRIAAGIAILSIIWVGISRIFSDRTTIQYETISYNASGSVSGYVLADGSHVFLNEGSEIKIPDNFTQNRTLELSGEAYFDVTHDPSRPFSIYADNTVITVLGTTFNVKENKSDGMVEVLVESGRVRVHDKQDESGITLLPGQFGKSDGKKTVLDVQEDVNYLSWKTRTFRFVNSGLDKVFSTLELSYHVKVDTGSLNLADMKLTSTYKDQSFESIIQTICTAFNLSYIRTDSGYRINPR